MPVTDRAAAVAAVGKHFSAAFKDNRFSSDFVGALVDALADIGVISYQAPAASAAAPAGAPALASQQAAIAAELAELHAAEAKLEAQLVPAATAAAPAAAPAA